jgi:hypothetical protein
LGLNPNRITDGIRWIGLYPESHTKSQALGASQRAKLETKFVISDGQPWNYGCHIRTSCTINASACDADQHAFFSKLPAGLLAGTCRWLEETGREQRVLDSCRSRLRRYTLSASAGGKYEARRQEKEERTNKLGNRAIHCLAFLLDELSAGNDS